MHQLVRARTTSAATLVSFFAVVLATSCGESPVEPRGNSSQLQVRIYDTSGRAEVEVRTADVLRRSARAQNVSGGSADVYFGLTTEGQAKFRRLTRTVARRGTRLHRLQRIAIEMDGKVYARPSIDYKIYPTGFDGSTGLLLASLKLATAERLVYQMRHG
jgi:preprotein translocase subunit SecD